MGFRIPECGAEHTRTVSGIKFGVPELCNICANRQTSIN